MQKENNQKTEQIKQTHPYSFNEAKKHNYSYWKTKPVANFGEISLVSQNIESNLENRKVYASDEEIKLPESMKWVSVDINNNESLSNVSKFLQTYYSTDDSDNFSYDYTNDFLKWAIGNDNICLTIVSKKSNAICGFISASFKKITVFEATKKFAVVNFLCAHPLYRTKNIAQTLIDEITRRTVKSGIQQGCFATQRLVPTPITTLRYYNRPTNYVKLQKYGFIDLEMMKPEKKRDPEKMQKMFDVVGDCGYIPMTLEHIEQVYKIYNTFINRYNIYVNYTLEDLSNNLLGNTNVVKSFVCVNNENIVTDFFSYYKLNYSVKNQTDKINVGYLFLYSCNMSTGKFIEGIIKTMKNNNIDLLNVRDTMIIPDIIYSQQLSVDENSDDESFTKSYQHGFLKGSEKLHLNFFNWKCPVIKSHQLSWPIF